MPEGGKISQILQESRGLRQACVRCLLWWGGHFQRARPAGNCQSSLGEYGHAPTRPFWQDRWRVCRSTARGRSQKDSSSGAQWKRRRRSGNKDEGRHAGVRGVMPRTTNHFVARIAIEHMSDPRWTDEQAIGQDRQPHRRTINNE